jgi:hypothetical protein
VSAAESLARAEAAGVRLRLRPDGGVRMEAAEAPPADIVAALRRWREDVAHLLAVRAALDAAQPVEDWRALPYGPARGAAFAVARRASGACGCCAGRRWWTGQGAQAGLRCSTCHPPPPGLEFRVVTT